MKNKILLILMALTICCCAYAGNGPDPITAISTSDLTDGSVTTAKIADSAVTNAKVATGTFAELNGQPTEDFNAKDLSTVNASHTGKLQVGDTTTTRGIINDNVAVGKGTYTVVEAYSSLAFGNSQTADFTLTEDSQLLIETTLTGYSSLSADRSKKTITAFYFDADTSISTPTTTDVYDMGSGSTVTIVWTWQAANTLRVTITNTAGSGTLFLPVVEYKFIGTKATLIQ